MGIGKLIRKALMYSLITLSIILNIAFIGSALIDFPLVNAIEVTFKKPAARLSAPPGRWHWIRKKDIHSQAESTRLEEIKRKLESIGYLAGYDKAPTQKNVTIYDRELAYNGLNLYTSGHGPEAILMDMDGKELHRWRYDLEKVFPEHKPPEGATGYPGQYWRRVYLYPNGDLLAIYEGIGLIKVDKNSNLIWAYPGRAHHDLFVAEDSTIYVLTREAKLIPKYNKKMPILEDFIVALDKNGKEIKKISILECLENSVYSPILQNISPDGDIFHTNTVDLLGGSLAHKSPAFKAGNILISIRNLNLVGIIDPQEKRVVWALTGMWRWQHQPTILDNGHMLVFDNLGLGKRSRVLEIDPFTQEVFWEYPGKSGEIFFTEDCGSSERLPNGNTLITESTAGRAFEVTPDKKIVWEFFNPHRAGENDELIATLFEVIRLSPDFPLDWLRNQ